MLRPSAAVLDPPLKVSTAALNKTEPPSRKSRLPALTGLRSFAALNLVFFHFGDPKDFGWFSPIVDNGYTSVSFFLLLSGFILAYNYTDRAARGEMNVREFWVARLSRLYPVYLFSLIISLAMLETEYHSQSRPMFFAGFFLTLTLLQGWSPALSTFWNTPAWTMCTEAFFYLLFPLALRWKRPRKIRWLFALLMSFWLVGMLCPALYTWLHPDGDLHPDRYSNGWWMRALKFTPPPHVPSFLFGIVLADLNERFPLENRWRLLLGFAGLGSLYFVLSNGDRLPYVFLHDGLLMPLFGLTILGLAGKNILARLFGFLPFVMLGEASYCLYLLHFNLWTLMHDSGVLQKTGLVRLDPWFSYLLLVLAAVMTMKWIERPGQRLIRRLAKG
ncbi:Acyltransferase [Acidisarcina polymorpha]|uniref:Acyltransferase n=1 Tax=Acidisarcina polymorpha TaxID=2211140 RepID=A0A2Z5G3D4_9BACT|nr:acyltransferase [Acidisarcina polymorpha]AXC13135.1 Acyltransferase [Acidisarcina polymorpha]